ncbi:MAG: Gfo/Idh/MocA family oxidoreductase [Acidobacteriota bacterium]
MAEQTRLRVAIVGAGLMGRWHAHAAVRLGVTVAAIVDPDSARARDLSAHHPRAKVVARLADVLGDVDVVHVCTPSRTHVALITEALDAGRHVLVEKPVAPTTDAVAALLELAGRRRVLLCPVHQFPFQAGFLSALAHIEAIGPLRQMSYSTCSAGAAGQDAAARAQVATDILPHPLSLFAKISTQVADVEWSVRAPVPGEIRALGQMGDVGLSIAISMSGRPTTNAIELIGERGTTVVDLFHGFAVTQDGRVSRWRKATKPLSGAARTALAATGNLVTRSWQREAAYPGLRRLMASFYEAIRAEGPSPLSIDETLAVARAGDRILQALANRVAREGR